MLEEEARQAKLAAAGRSGEALSSQEREKINKIVEEASFTFIISNNISQTKFINSKQNQYDAFKNTFTIDVML